MRVKQCMLALVAALLMAMGALSWAATQGNSVVIPILMYHHLAQEANGPFVISEVAFRRQMDFLKEQGYTPISFDQLIAYVNEKEELPDKPVCITFDDGYYSNYSIALPILQEFGFHATVFMIGSQIRSEEVSPDSGGVLSYLSGTEISQLQKSGLVQVQSHTYDMHQINPGADGILRPDVLPLEGESDADYIAKLTEDYYKEAAALAPWGVDKLRVVAYPNGRSCELSDQTLASLGVEVTLTTDSGHVNRVIQGKPQSLIGLGRLNVCDETTQRELLNYLRRK